MTVDCIQDAQGFQELRTEWQELLRESDADNPFLTWEWLHSWWTHAGTAGTLRLLVVRDGDTTLAIAPFRLVSAPLYWFSRLEFLGTGEAGSDYLDIIARRGSEPRAIESIAQFLEAQQLAVRLTHLPQGSLAAQLADRMADDGWTSSFTEDGQCPIINLSGHTFDSLLGTLGASHRANVRRRLRALERLGARFERITDHGERQQMLDLLATFHSKRYADRGGSTAFGLASVRAFHEEATRLALERGWLRMYVLRIGESVAAVMYGFIYQGRFYFYQHGYDADQAAHSVGLALMALSIRAAIDEGATEFDMLWGTEAYKALWARDSRSLQRADLFPVRLGGTVQRHAVEARRGVAHLARRVLSLRSPGAPRGI
ncbi:MAG TPA: GNAT family N-acetyltransferase [Vicinamibacterales bacterium]|nr:GNAT family N-acetyltransferase [Vicinamibacterales bacterium]